MACWSTSAIPRPMKTMPSAPHGPGWRSSRCSTISTPGYCTPSRCGSGSTPASSSSGRSGAAPDTVVISAITQRLIAGLFESREPGSHELKGIPAPLPVYRVVKQSDTQSRFEVAVRTGLTPLVGREQEVGLLLDHWERVKAGEGQV